MWLLKHIFHNQKLGAAKLEPEDGERNLYAPVEDDGPKTDWHIMPGQAINSLLIVFRRKIQTPLMHSIRSRSLSTSLRIQVSLI